MTKRSGPNERGPSRMSSFPGDGGGGDLDGSSSSTTGVAKVIKGEIHNVLSMMRTDPRYASPLRFIQEMLPQGPSAPSVAEPQHPLISNLTDLADELSRVELSVTATPSTPTASGGRLQASKQQPTSSGGSSSSSSLPPAQALDVLTYVAPFTTAISSREINAAITGASLSALHKFLIYGFISPDSVGALEGITVIARSIRHCTFEESGSSAHASAAAAAAAARAHHARGAPPPPTSSPSALRPRSTYIPSGTSARVHDEEVVLKLLSLAVLVVRCEVGAMLDPLDVVGIFDTCLHVAYRAKNASALLRSAAADALGHIVLVVFSRAGRYQRNRQRQKTNRQPSVGPTSNNDASEEDDDASDDSWSEADPSRTPVQGADEPTGDASTTTTTSASSGEKESSGGDSQQHQQQQHAKPKKDSIFSFMGNMRKRASEVSKKLQRGGDKSAAAKKEALPLPRPAFVTIMSRLADLVSPLHNTDAACVMSLGLINIALETADASYLTQYTDLVDIMQNTLCKHLLQLSTTADLVILSLSLRAIFNLFNSIKDHLKVQLEVFLTSVHLRMLDGSNTNSTPEQKEVVLESLLEFCHEPALMHDLYMNYDCDVHCTNLFETICRVLCQVACPGMMVSTASLHGGSAAALVMSSPPTPPRPDNNAPASSTAPSGDATANGTGAEVEPYVPPLNVLNALAIEAVLSVIDSIAQRCTTASSSSAKVTTPPSSSTGIAGMNDEYDEDSFTTENTTADSNSDADSDSAPRPAMVTHESSLDDEEAGEDGGDWVHRTRERTAEMLQERKKRKHRLALAAAAFNRRPMGKEWIQSAEQIGVFPSPATAESVASFLYSAPKLDKAKVGIYLSKGPKEKYPFHTEVLHHFLEHFDFTGMSFSEALRSFLLRFRLPGEAQCIDRLMEAFAERLYQQQKQEKRRSLLNLPTQEMLAPIKAAAEQEEEEKEGSGDADKKEGDAAEASDDKEPEDPRLPFRSSDAVYVLAFSTIMLNTDLHNPSLKDDRRMTIEQFIRNNRGINDGKDLPAEFLTDLYSQIKNDEIQVKTELQDMIQGGGEHGDSSFAQWDGILSKKDEVATACFTPADAARRTVFRAGVHERDMFLAIAPSALQAFSTFFVRSWNEDLVVQVLKGFRKMAKICVYYNMDETFNNVLTALLTFGRDYLTATAAAALRASRRNMEMMEDEDDTGGGGDADGGESPMHGDTAGDGGPEDPKSRNFKRESVYRNNRGGTLHRGLLALDCAMTLSRSQIHRIQSAWPRLLQCICLLRDSGAVPISLAELDDFADSQGTVLPPSPFAIKSQLNASRYLRAITLTGRPVSDGFWGTLSPVLAVTDSMDEDESFDDGDDYDEEQPQQASAAAFMTSTTFASSSELRYISESFQLDEMLMRAKGKTLVTRILQALLDAVDPANLDSRLLTDDDDAMTADPDLIFEHHSVFCLELAARSLFFNQDRATEFFPVVLSKFESALSPQSSAVVDTRPPEEGGGENFQPHAVKLVHPYLMERVVVTVLRSCIHMYDMPEMRPYLKTSLLLLLNLPPLLAEFIANRLGCGMAIILRASFAQLHTADDWTLMGDLLHVATKYAGGRGFVFDGIASCVEHAMPPPPFAPPSEEKLQQESAESTPNNNGTTEVTESITYDGACLFARLLTKLVFCSSGEGETAMAVPALVCLERVYWHLSQLAKETATSKGEPESTKVPDEELWQSLCSACYCVCLSTDPHSAVQGVECLQRFLLMTDVNAVSPPAWLTVLETITTRPPELYMDVARVKVSTLLGKMLLVTIPELSQVQDHWKALTDIVNRTAEILGENLREGRQGSVSILFESTVETVTNLSNVMSMPEFDRGSGFGVWASETLYTELEKVGAVGKSARMVAATTKMSEEEAVEKAMTTNTTTEEQPKEAPSS